MYRHTTSKMSKLSAYGASLVLVLGGGFVAGAPAAAAQRPTVTTPTGFQAEVGASSVTVTWEPSTSREAEVTIYTVYAAGRWFVLEEPTLTLFVERDTSYGVRVRARDAEYNRSEWSETFRFRTSEEFPVTTPGNVRVSTSPGTATVEWDESSSDAGVLDYLLTVTGGTQGTLGGRTSGTSLTYDLPAGGDFQVTVKGRDKSYRYSDSSEPVSFTVDPAEGFAPPTAPEDLELMFSSGGLSELATWEPSEGTGPITYELRIDGMAVDFTQDTELEVFDFVRCSQFSSPPMEVSVVAAANGFKSEPSNSVEACF